VGTGAAVPTWPHGGGQPGMSKSAKGPVEVEPQGSTTGATKCGARLSNGLPPNVGAAVLAQAQHRADW